MLFGIVKLFENDLRIIILIQNKIKLSVNYFSSKKSFYLHSIENLLETDIC